MQEYPYSKKEKFEMKMEKTVRDMDKKIEALKLKSRRGEAAVKEDVSLGIQELEAKKEAARLKLKDLKEATKENWEEMKTSARSAVDELEDSYRRTVSRFKND